MIYFDLKIFQGNKGLQGSIGELGEKGDKGKIGNQGEIGNFIKSYVLELYSTLSTVIS